MHDIAFIRHHPEAFDAALQKRGAEPAADRIVALDAKKREAQTRVQEAQSRRNEASKAIGQAMGQGDKDKAEALFQQALALNPNGIDPNYFHGDFLLRQKRYGEARTALEKALAAPARPGREVADAGRRDEARALLAQVKEKLE